MASIRQSLKAFYLLVSLMLFAGLNTSMWTSEDERRLLLDNEQHRQLYFKDRRMHLARDTKLAYVHIPKTGGSTIEDSALFDHKRRLGASPRSHFSVRTLTNATATDGFTVATHIRNPCDRFVSAFLYIRHDDRSRGMRQTAADFGMFESETTEEFVDWLEATNSWGLLKDTMLHFRPMVNWLVMEDTDTFGVDVVMCQEQWEEGVDRLAKELNLSSVPDNLMDMKRVNEVHTTSCRDMEPHYGITIMNEYALDACLFGYGKFDWKLVGHNESVCIGTGNDRKWFSERLVFCKRYLRESISLLSG